AFKKGKAKIYIYHRGCNSLTSLHFDRHDEQVSSIDHRRAIFTKVKGIAQWATCWGTGKLTCSFLGHMPILGVVLGGVVGVATSVAGVIALYKTYDSFCPTEVKRSINAFWKKKARSFAPMLNTWLRDFYRDSRGVYPLAPEDPPSWTPASSR
ncbi:MAG: hypothetical protein LBB05_04180, partial [Puniceicoccales bacterium]|nr:hypothetical protein [Puniceicoccales bacterium]